MSDQFHDGRPLKSWNERVDENLRGLALSAQQTDASTAAIEEKVEDIRTTVDRMDGRSQSADHTNRLILFAILVLLVIIAWELYR